MTQTGWPYRASAVTRASEQAIACVMIQITRFPSRWFTITRRAGVGAGYPAGGPGRFDETDYRQGKV
jgi:hypothetical protein